MFQQCLEKLLFSEEHFVLCIKKKEIKSKSQDYAILCKTSMSSQVIKGIVLSKMKTVIIYVFFQACITFFMLWNINLRYFGKIIYIYIYDFYIFYNEIQKFKGQMLFGSSVIENIFYVQ